MPPLATHFILHMDIFFYLVSPPFPRMVEKRFRAIHQLSNVPPLHHSRWFCSSQPKQMRAKKKCRQIKLLAFEQKIFSMKFPKNDILMLLLMVLRRGRKKHKPVAKFFLTRGQTIRLNEFLSFPPQPQRRRLSLLLLLISLWAIFKNYCSFLFSNILPRNLIKENK